MPGQFSIEMVFRPIQVLLSQSCDFREIKLPFVSRGMFRRLLNLFFLAFKGEALWHIVGDVYFCAIVLRGNIVITIHDCVSLHRLKGVRRWLLKLLWYELPLRRAKIVTVISPTVREELLACTNADPSKVVIVPNCVSPKFRPAPRVTGQKPRVLFLGSTVNKNAERAFQSLAGLDCELRLIGRLSLDCDRILREQSIAYSRAEDLTEEEIYREYCDADVVLFPSLYEGFGMPIVEAQAVGRIVVTSRIEPMLWVSGGAAIFVDPYSIDSIRAGVQSALQNQHLRDELIQKGLENVLRFQAPEVTRSYMNIYQGLYTGC